MNAIVAIVLLCSALDVRTALDSLFTPAKGIDAPGCNVGIFQKGTILYHQQYGDSDVENRIPLGPDSAFNIGSMSKQFTAMAVLLLARDGKLALDGDVHKYLPELPRYSSPLTIRNLLNHTGGVRDYEQLLLVAGWRYAADEITNDDALHAVLHQRGLNFMPASEFLYSNSGYLLLAEIVRRVSGIPFERFLAERIFQPLGMTHTVVMTDWDTFIPNRTEGYVDPKTRLFWPYFAIGDGNVVTTIGDLLKWDENFYRPMVGDANIIAEMMSGGTLSDGTKIQYAFGLYDLTYRGERVIEHDGETPGYESDMLRFPGRHISIAVLCNSSAYRPDVVTMAHSIADAVVFESPNPAQPAPAVGVAGESFRRFAGVYWSDSESASRTFAFRGGRFVLVRRDGSTVDLPALDDHTLRFGRWRRYTFSDDGTFMNEREGDAVAEIGSVTKHLFRRVPPPDAMPQSFAGTYCNDELQTRWTFVAKSGQLVLSRDRHADEVLTQIFRGAYRESDVNILFHKAGFTAANQVLRTVEFHRCR